MLLEKNIFLQKEINLNVLILIVMEDALREFDLQLMSLIRVS